MNQTPLKLMAAERFGDILLQAISPQPIPDSEWDAYFAMVLALQAQHGTPPLALQYTLKQGPNAAQRKRMSDAIGDRLFKKLALISSSAMVRGAVTALNWLTRNRLSEIRAFNAQETRIALLWLREHGEFGVDAAYRKLDELAKACGYPGVDG